MSILKFLYNLHKLQIYFHQQDTKKLNNLSENKCNPDQNNQYSETKQFNIKISENHSSFLFGAIFNKNTLLSRVTPGNFVNCLERAECSTILSICPFTTH